MKNEIKTERIPWIDVYRGLAIILMVVGHATGTFNGYIYQFHMAAFFFISGYTMKKKKTLISELVTVCYRLLLPIVIMFLVGTVVMAIENRLNIYTYLYLDTFPYMSGKQKLQEFFLHGMNYVWWMGACWFVFALAGIKILWRVLLELFENLHPYCLLVGSAILYAIGVYFVNNGIRPRAWAFELDLILMLQLFYYLGYFLKSLRVIEKIQLSRWRIWISLAAVIVCMAAMYGFRCLRVTVNYPNRNFDNAFLVVAAGLNGSILLVAVSSLLAQIIYVRRPLAFLGNNSLGIMLFHFTMFKAGYLLLIAAGIAPLSYLRNLVNDPATVAGNQFWWVSAITGLLFSVWFWRLLLTVRPLKICLGQDASTDRWLCNWFARLYKQLAVHMKMKRERVVDRLTLNGKSRAFVQQYAWWMIVLVLLVICVSDPIVRSKIMCNDELQFSVHRMKGLLPIIKSTILHQIEYGQVARIMAAVFCPLSFLSKSVTVSRIIQCGFLLLGSCNVYLFVLRLWKNKRIALLSAILFLCLLPITFEHAVPNAFNGLCIIPLCILLCSFSHYLIWLDDNKNNCKITAIVLFCIAVLSYEFIITYILVFPILYVARRFGAAKAMKKLISDNIAFIFIAGLFFALLFIAPKFASMQYTGTTIGFVSLASSMQIVLTLFLSCIPEYYIFNGKYIYLYTLYTNSASVKFGSSYIVLMIKQILHDPRTLCISACLFLILIWLLSDTMNEKNKCSPWPLLVCGAYMMIPSFPNAVSKMYQGIVTDTSFTSLPVSIFLYAACIIGIAYYISFCKKRHLVYKIVLASFFCMLAALTQTMNTTFSNVHYANYQRLELAQDFIKDDTLGKALLKDKTISAPELYETRNSLAVCGSKNDDFDYWNEFAKAEDVGDVDFVKSGKAADCSLHYQMNDRVLVYQDSEQLILYSHERIQQNTPIRLFNDNLITLHNMDEALTRQAPFVYWYPMDAQ